MDSANVASSQGPPIAPASTMRSATLPRGQVTAGLDDEAGSASRPGSNKRSVLPSTEPRKRQGGVDSKARRCHVQQQRNITTTLANGAAPSDPVEATTAALATTSSEAALPPSSALSVATGRGIHAVSHDSLQPSRARQDSQNSCIPCPLPDYLPRAITRGYPPLRHAVSTPLPLLATHPKTTVHKEKRWQPLAPPIPPAPLYGHQDAISALPLQFRTKNDAELWARVYIGAEDQTVAAKWLKDGEGKRSGAAEIGRHLVRAGNGGRSGDVMLQCAMHKRTGCFWKLMISRSTVSAKSGSTSTSMSGFSPGPPLEFSFSRAGPSQEEDTFVQPQDGSIYRWEISNPFREHSHTCRRNPLYPDLLEAFNKYLEEKSKSGETPASKSAELELFSSFAASWHTDLMNERRALAAGQSAAVSGSLALGGSIAQGGNSSSNACRGVRGKASPQHVGELATERGRLHGPSEAVEQEEDEPLSDYEGSDYGSNISTGESLFPGNGDSVGCDFLQGSPNEPDGSNGEGPVAGLKEQPLHFGPSTQTTMTATSSLADASAASLRPPLGSRPSSPSLQALSVTATSTATPVQSRNRTFWPSLEPQETLCAGLEQFLPGVSKWMRERMSERPAGSGQSRWTRSVRSTSHASKRPATATTSAVLNLSGLVHAVDDLMTHAPWAGSSASTARASLGLLPSQTIGQEEVTFPPPLLGIIIHVPETSGNEAPGSSASSLSRSSNVDEGSRGTDGILLMWPSPQQPWMTSYHTLLNRCRSIVEARKQVHQSAAAQRTGAGVSVVEGNTSDRSATTGGAHYASSSLSSLEGGSVLCFYSEVMIAYPTMEACLVRHHLLLPSGVTGYDEQQEVEALAPSSAMTSGTTTGVAVVVQEEIRSDLQATGTVVSRLESHRTAPGAVTSCATNQAPNCTPTVTSVVTRGAHLHHLVPCQPEELLARLQLTECFAPATLRRSPNPDCMYLWKPNRLVLQRVLDLVPGLAGKLGS
ncbi:hypothetical protein BCV69DRAFT_315328 [Microstroma glucosiphilum]|uniref:Uncharacterized protein n=1 Tax=Pseudomicrostroma glucosiphilum TaxID=1684307 RepID=A0A316U408_9BASI|nr:hypothetical protein BCV69DRAFT_315328 [Pseudomicrostroma glucosiphilum]PWN17645.1 hypothetical protein BCV69DRAFT_315328 [Pseudomicrostroma glucosiphilum]